MKKQNLPLPGPAARALLHIQLPLVVVAAVAFLISYLQARAISPSYANLHYPYQLEYILASLSISAAGFWLVDATERGF